ncbi:hypothetical protein M0R45_008858 [Rubus argutus]|uniref:Uncharacterized protein n=1 Tax=Rubus argutus TaxID=59490 RepID=A0AAW1Y4X9_RUBAR
MPSCCRQASLCLALNSIWAQSRLTAAFLSHHPHIYPSPGCPEILSRRRCSTCPCVLCLSHAQSAIQSAPTSSSTVATITLSPRSHMNHHSHVAHDVAIASIGFLLCPPAATPSSPRPSFSRCSLLRWTRAHPSLDAAIPVLSHLLTSHSSLPATTPAPPCHLRRAIVSSISQSTTASLPRIFSSHASLDVQKLKRRRNIYGLLKTNEVKKE